MQLDKSPLAPESFPELEQVSGVRMFVGATGETYGSRANVLMALFDPGSVGAGVFTRSRCASAPVEWCRDILGEQHVRGLVVNAGNANAFSGKRGALAVDRFADYVSNIAKCHPREIMLASTGVIGEPLEPGPVLQVLENMEKGAPASFHEAAVAIGTTDTFAKGAGAAFEVDGQKVNISGIAKGSGMIQPDMATMLSFVFTDMAIEKSVLQHVLSENIKTSFNAITVDSDTSTSDTCLIVATGAATGVKPIETLDDPRLGAFSSAVHDVLFDLALQVVRDGEGATKLIEVEVRGAASDDSARIVARSIANSPLVKTAIAGEDANWGRVVMAVGKAGEPADRDRLSIRFGELVLAENGMRAQEYDEDQVSAYMKNDVLKIGVDLGVGEGQGTIFTCDLTHGYISINGDYRS